MLSVNSISDLMGYLLKLTLALFTALAAAGKGFGQVREAETPAPLAHDMVSSSEQFRIYGSDRKTRGTLAIFAERQKTAYLQLLNAHDQWEHRIVIHVKGLLTDPPVRRPIAERIRDFDGAFGLEIHVTLCTKFSRERLRQAILRMLMFETALRDAAPGNVNRRLVPRWLEIGLPGALELKTSGRPSKLFSQMFKLDLITPIGEMLAAENRETDSVSRTFFKASASGLVLMLLDQTDGPKKLDVLIQSLGERRSLSPRDLLARYFPVMRGSDERVEKEWLLYCGSKLAAPQALEFMSPKETEAALSEALKVSFLEFKEPDEEEVRPSGGERRIRLPFWRRKDDQTEETADVSHDNDDDKEQRADTEETQTFEGSLEDFERFIRRKDREEILFAMRQRLLQLAVRSFPLYRPIVQDYIDVVEQLREKWKKGKIEEKLQALAAERTRLTENLQQISDHLNHYEVQEMTSKSGVFNEYLQRAKELEDEHVPKGDAISKYLDLVEETLE